MIGYLNGTVEHTFEEALIINVQGVGYEVTVSHAVMSLIGPNRQISVIVFTDVKENAITLYGFSSWVEREVFLLLRKVKGIGSKLAMAIVSALGAEGVLVAIGSADHQRLVAIPGVGKKTAERVLMELREQVKELLPTSSSLSSSIQVSHVANESRQNHQLSGIALDAALALEKLGFSREKSIEAISKTLASPEQTYVDAGELLKDAFARL